MCVFLYNPTLFYSVSLIYFFRAATAFDIFGTDNAEESLTCGFQYPSLPISILHFVARNIEFGDNLANFDFLVHFFLLFPLTFVLSMPQDSNPRSVCIIRQNRSTYSSCSSSHGANICLTGDLGLLTDVVAITPMPISVARKYVFEPKLNQNFFPARTKNWHNIQHN